jgi:hypothetical protein
MHKRTRLVLSLALLGMPLLGVGGWPVNAADHGDTPHLISIPRHDARISDLHVFTHGENLVLSLCTFPNLPGTSYQFAADLTLRFHIDNHSQVTFDDPTDEEQFGGTIVSPNQMAADIVLEFTFDDLGNPILAASGLTSEQEEDIQVFAGMRDDPFIRGPQIGRNVAAVVVELPLAHVLRSSPTLLVWATSKVPDLSGPQSELGGRALRSQCPQPVCNALDGPDLNLRNEISPHKYSRELGLRPDAVIFDTSRPAGFPNGRLLTDDVVSIVAAFGQNILNNDFPCPSTNDVPFLSSFPYLAPPQFGAPTPAPGPCAQ